MIGNLIIGVIGYGAAAVCTLLAATCAAVSYREFCRGDEAEARSVIAGAPTMTILALAFAGVTKWMTGL